ncbi:MAG: glycosyltransferase family 4 protein [Bacteriovoracia bacterium]
MSGKKVVQFVKTFEGALWAVQQVKNLQSNGWDVHVVSPSLEGRYSSEWQKTGATLHALPCEFPVKSPWLLPSIKEQLVTFINEIKPDLIHSHFVSTTLMLRYALKDSSIPRIFQVPGPLHLEHPVFGQWETMWSDANDYWIASSDFIKSLYTKRYSVDSRRIYKSYYGTEINEESSARTGNLRQKYSIPESATLVGNVSFIYPPKHYLGQTTGLKGHELMIDALAEVMEKNEDLWAVFIGQQWGKSQNYFEKLKKYAEKKSSRIIFTGYIPQKEILSIWKEFDLALHLPSSENCGGVIEPMINNVPTIASNVGGLPEVVLEGKTGFITERKVERIVEKINKFLSHPEEGKALAKNGKVLVSTMFDVKRTSREIGEIYEHILGFRNERPDFDANKFLR